MGDPLSITAGVAGIISLGLTVCSGLLEYYGSWKDSPSNVSTMYESLGALTKTFEILHEKVRHPLLDSKIVDRVTESIISCAAGVQRLQSKLEKIRDVKPGRSAYLQRAHYPFRQKTLVNLHQIISDLRSNLGLAAGTLQLDVATTSLHRLNQLEKKTETLIATSKTFNMKALDGISQLRLGQEQEKLRWMSTEERDAISWLSPLDFVAKQNDALSRRQHGTGRWLLDSSEFRSWISIAGKVLWCPGMPGAGKTILASTAIDYLEREHRRAQVGVAYVYCLYNDAHQTAASLLGSLLQQLARQNDAIRDDIKSCHKHHTDWGTRPTLYEISRLLCLQVQNFDEVFIIIDALDECPEAGQVRRDFLMEVRRLLPDIRLMVTSRHLASIESTFKQDTRLEIRAHDQDVRKFIEAQVERTELVHVLEGHDNMRSLIGDMVLKKTNGMFLLAALHMDSLSREDNVRDIRENLQSLPEDLDIIYDEALKRIKRQDRRQLARAEQVLTLINCAYRPLKMKEIQHMLSIRPDDKDPDLEALPRVDSLLSACCGLVVLEDESQIVRLVHYTTEEYFNRINLYRNPESHCAIAGTLITYLSFTTFASFPLGSSDSGNPGPDRGRGESIASYRTLGEVETNIKDLLEKNILLQYAAQNWGNHAREALADFSAKNFGVSHSIAVDAQRGRVNSTWDLKQMIPNLLIKTSNISCAVAVLFQAELFRYFNIASTYGLINATGLQIAARFGIYYFVKEYLDKGENIDARDHERKTALHYAATNGHTEIVQLLLDSGSSIEARDGDGRTAFQWSVAAGRLSVVRLLLQRGSQSRITDRGDLSPVMVAAEKGHEEILEFFAEYEANQSERDESMGNALVYAAGIGQESIVRLLMRSGKSWNISKDSLADAIVKAARSGELVIMKMLLEAGVAVNCFSREHYTPLGEAAGSGQAKASRLLLEAGADANKTDKYGDNPLHKAVRGGYTDIVALLLEAGADVNTPGQSKESPIVALAKRGYTRERAAMVQQLLESGADPTGRDEDFGRTSLEWSILQGDEASVEILLKYDRPDPSRRNLMLLLTKIYHAVRSGSGEAITDQLLSKVEIPRLQTIAELLLLYIPAEKGYEGVVRLLLDLGATIEARGPDGEAALHLASGEGHTGIVQLLINRRADVDAQAAASKGRKTIREFLLNNGASIDALQEKDGTALAHAVAYRHPTTAKLLLERGADVNTEIGSDGGTVLHLAARSPEYWVEMLLRKGADLESKDHFGQTPLVVAARCGQAAAAQILLDKGANPHALPHAVTPMSELIYEYDFNDAVELVVEAQKKSLISP